MFDVHWGLDFSSTDTEAVSVSVQEGGLDIGTMQGSRYPYKKRESTDNETLGS